ncbi:MAG: hypothetical protein AAFV45_05425 [Pseudomonadota bacterium]
MKIPFDIADVPTVAADRMEQALNQMIATGHTSVLFKGHSRSAREQFEDHFWADFEGSTAEGVAILVRLWSLIDVLQSRRLARILLSNGFAVLQPLARAAANLRLNANWGFAPQKVVWWVSSQRALTNSTKVRLKARIETGYQVRSTSNSLGLAA